MIEVMVTIVVTTIVLSLAYLIHNDPTNVMFGWALIGFIAGITLTGVYVLLRTLHEPKG